MNSRHLVFLTFALALMGCKTPLQQYIANRDYEPFIIPRDNWVRGTIISFSTRGEHIEAFAHECINIQTNSANIANVVLEETSYEVERDDKLELNLAKVLDPYLNLAGAFKRKDVKSVAIRMHSPREVSFSELQLQRRILELLRSNQVDCVQQIFDPANFIIFRVLMIEGIEYSLLDKQNTVIKLDADILTNINASAELSKRFEGKTTLSASMPICVGYRLFKPKRQQSTATNVATALPDFETVSKREIAYIKSGDWQGKFIPLTPRLYYRRPDVVIPALPPIRRPEPQPPPTPPQLKENP